MCRPRSPHASARARFSRGSSHQGPHHLPSSSDGTQIISLPAGISGPTAIGKSPWPSSLESCRPPPRRRTVRRIDAGGIARCNYGVLRSLCAPPFIYRLACITRAQNTYGIQYWFHSHCAAGAFTSAEVALVTPAARRAAGRSVVPYVNANKYEPIVKRVLHKKQMRTHARQTGSQTTPRLALPPHSQGGTHARSRR